jgi:hypothetical protein
MEPDLSNTNDIMSLGRVAWALEPTFNVLDPDSKRKKKVSIVAVALTLKRRNF